MSTVTEDAYERLKKMLDGKEKEIKYVMLTFSEKDKYEIYQLIKNSLIRHADVPDYHADILSDHLLTSVLGIFDLKQKKHANNIARQGGKVLSEEEVEKQETGKLSPMFSRVDE